MMHLVQLHHQNSMASGLAI